MRVACSPYEELGRTFEEELLWKQELDRKIWGVGGIPPKDKLAFLR